MALYVKAPTCATWHLLRLDGSLLSLVILINVILLKIKAKEDSGVLLLKIKAKEYDLMITHITTYQSANII